MTALDEARRRRMPTPIAPLQGTLALSLHEPAAPPAPTRRTHGFDIAEVDPQRRKRFDQWAGRFLQSAVDVVAGQRSATQLVRWMQPDVHEDLVRRAQLVRGSVSTMPGQPTTLACPNITSLHTSFIARTTCEAAAVVRYGARFRALAARFELIDGRMQCTALEWA